MMKLLMLIAVALLITGCSGPELVSPDEFKKHYLDVGVMHSMRHVTFLGIREGRAFLKIRSMRVVGDGWKERVIFVELKDLDDAFRSTLTERPNQSPEPTAMLVTPRAGARVAPSTAVAHL